MSNQEHQLIANRRAKLQSRRELATIETPVFPNSFYESNRHDSEDLEMIFGSIEDFDSMDNEERFVSFVGRVMLKRGPFIVVQDSLGQTQFYANKKECDPELFAEVKSWDAGDIVEGAGYMNRSKMGGFVYYPYQKTRNAPH